MNVQYIGMATLTGIMLVYLVYTLVYPEKF